MDPKPFLRGVAFEGNDRVPYPRANPKDFARLPLDTWNQACIPVGVRLELDGDATEIEIAYRTKTDDLGYRGDGAGRTFSVWSGGERIDQEKAELGEGTVKLAVRGPSTVYLPEGMRPTIDDVQAVNGSIEPAPPQPRWIAYGDSVAEGWCASEPALAWPAIAGREHDLDVVNMGYAGAARGEMVSAEHIADMQADVISITHGTNCWTRIPHSVEQFRANLAAFLDVVRQGHPETPILVASPIVRPDAETTPNRLGASLEDLRAAMEDAVRQRDDDRLELIRGRDLVDESQLGDGIHPNEDGHRALAGALGPAIKGLV